MSVNKLSWTRSLSRWTGVLLLLQSLLENGKITNRYRINGKKNYVVPTKSAQNKKGLPKENGQFHFKFPYWKKHNAADWPYLSRRWTLVTSLNSLLRLALWIRRLTMCLLPWSKTELKLISITLPHCQFFEQYHVFNLPGKLPHFIGSVYCHSIYRGSSCFLFNKFPICCRAFGMRVRESNTSSIATLRELANLTLQSVRSCDYWLQRQLYGKCPWISTLTKFLPFFPREKRNSLIGGKVIIRKLDTDINKQISQLNWGGKSPKSNRQLSLPHTNLLCHSSLEFKVDWTRLGRFSQGHSSLIAFSTNWSSIDAEACCILPSREKNKHRYSLQINLP